MNIGVPDADLKFDAMEPQQYVERADDAVEPAPPPTPVHGGDLDQPDDIVVEEPAQQARDEEIDLGVVDGTFAREVYPRTFGQRDPDEAVDRSTSPDASRCGAYRSDAGPGAPVDSVRGVGGECP